MLVELSFMFIIILGRWILPKGNISHSALSQLLLVYLSLASDILDLLSLFNEQEIYISSSMVHLVLTVFSLCMLQFALNLTATRGRSFRAEINQTDMEIHSSSALPSRSRRFFSRFLPRTSPSSSIVQRKLPLKQLKRDESTTNIARSAATIVQNPAAHDSQMLPSHPTHLGR
jgi:hypothetical protein